MTYPIFKQTYLYSFELQNKTIDIFWNTLSKKQILNIYNLHSQENLSYFLSILQTSLHSPTKIELLSTSQIQDLAKKIMDRSNLKSSVLDSLEKSFLISSNKNLNGDTWDCEVCKERGLQDSRGCPIIDSKNDINMFVDGIIYKKCPIYYIDIELLSLGYECYTMYDKGIFPEEGGLYDQTVAFGEISKKMSYLISNKQNKQYNDG